MQRHRARLLASVSALILAACGGGGADPVSPPAPPPPPPPPSPAPVASVTVAPDAGSLVPLQTLQIAATPKDASGAVLTGRTVSWTSGTPAVATVDGTGLVAAVAPGTAVITATSEGRSATATLTVGEGGFLGAAGGTVTAAAGAVSVVVPAGALTAGTAITVAPTTSPPANPRLVTGSAYELGPNGATFVQPVTIRLRYTTGQLAGGTDESQLRLHLLTGSTWESVDGSSVDVATRTVSGTTTHFSTYAILRLAGVQTVAVAPESDSVLVGGTKAFTATVSADQGVAQTVTWSSSNQAVATISTAGLATAVGAGVTTITATSTVDGARKGTATLKVSAPVFPITWTETSDGRFGPATPIPVLNRLAPLPDGSTIGVGAGGAIARRSAGGTWTLDPSPTGATLWDVVVISADSIWAVGDSGVILRRTPAGWVKEASPVSQRLYRLAMRPDGTGMAVGGTGNVGVVLERSGGVWQAVPLPGTPVVTQLIGVAVAGTDAFVLANLEHVILKRSGGTWSTVAAPPPSALATSLGNLSSTEIFVGANLSSQATVYRLSGNSWIHEFSTTTTTTANGTYAFTPCAGGSFMAVTGFGTVLRRVGGAWSELPDGRTGPYGSGSIGSVACPQASGYVFAAGAVLGSATAGGTLTYEQYNANYSRLAMGRASFAFAAQGNSGRAVRYDGTSWTPFPIPSETVGSTQGPTFGAFANGQGMMTGAGAVGVYNGTGWTWSAKSLPASTGWGSSTTDFWTAGYGSNSAFSWGSAVQRWNGGSWSGAIPEEYNSRVYGADGAGPAAVFLVGADNWIIGNNGMVVRNGPGGVRVDTIPGGKALLAVVAFSANSAVAVGQAGLAVLWNGTSWTPIPLPTTENVLAVTGRSAQEVYAFTGSGRLWGWNGTGWSQIKQFTRIVRAARMVGNAGIAVGDDGMVVYGRP